MKRYNVKMYSSRIGPEEYLQEVKNVWGGGRLWKLIFVGALICTNLIELFGEFG